MPPGYSFSLELIFFFFSLPVSHELLEPRRYQIYYVTLSGDICENPDLAILLKSEPTSRV